MASTKPALKAAKSALDSQNFDEAVIQARIVLDTDANNYFGHLFLGRALEKLGKVTEAEKSYTAATEIKPGDELAWKGLRGILESQGSSKVSGFTSASSKLAQIYAEANDLTQCLNVVEKCLSFAKLHGTRNELKEALAIELPTSPLYEILEGRIPNALHTYTRIAEITEIEEKERINKLVGERRTRLGAKVDQVTADAVREVYSKSNLEDLYQEIVNWASDEQVRREYEEKLLQRAYDLLVVMHPEEKTEKLVQVLKLSHDMVIIKYPFHLAWSIELEWKDTETLQDLDFGILHEYMEFFPDDGLSKVILAHIGKRKLSESAIDETSHDSKRNLDKVEKIDSEERLLLITDGLEDCKDSAFASRIAAEFFLHLGEHEMCAEISRQGIRQLKLEMKKCGLPMQHNLDAIIINLATSLVYYQAPKNHPEARELFEDILERIPNSTAALLGVGLIYEEQQQYDKAVEFLSRATLRDPDNKTLAAEAAWCQALNGQLEVGLELLEFCLSNLELIDFKTRQLKAKIYYWIGRCMWDLKSDRAARRDRQGSYARYINAIKLDPDLAPAYTALGIYFADYSRDKKRARQCFQKAFELSPSEVVAAERLSQLFADESDWDLVELVAQRTVDSGILRAPPGSKRKSISWPFAALGVAQMGKQEYHQSIQSFQAALRISPNDYHSWVGLGESYSSSGRYNAALGALELAINLHGSNSDNTEDKWFAIYMLSNVNKDLGSFDEALRGYNCVLKDRPGEFGVLVAKLQTLVERAWNSIEVGFFGRAVQSARAAIFTCNSVAKLQPAAFNLWKALGDACAVFTAIPGNQDVPHSDITRLLKISTGGNVISLANNKHDSELPLCDDNVSHEALPKHSVTTPRENIHVCMIYCILAQKKAIQCSPDRYAQAVAWYNLGWGERRMQSFCRKEHGRNDEAVRYGKAAVQCFKRAIELEAGNAEFWNSLGIVTADLNPKVAQHAFVRSLHLNERSARTWTNLGILCLLQHDHELAHSAFARAQSTDPDYAHAWVGEGLLALLVDDPKEGLSHFTHAFEIAGAASIPSKTLYAQSTFDQLQNGLKGDISHLVAPIFALQQLQNQILDIDRYQHLLALLYERVGDHTAAIDQLEKVCKAAEEHYEVSESDEDAENFARAMTDLSRNKLEIGELDQAMADATTALDLTIDESTKASAQLVLDVASGKQDLEENKVFQPVYDAKTVILRNPWEISGWDMLGDLVDNAYVQQIALLNALRGLPEATLDPVQLGAAFARVGSVRNAQCAIAVCPWREEGWLTLENAIARV